MEELTPMQRMIEWIESGCSTSGKSWETFKELMLQSEQFSIIKAKTDEFIDSVKHLTNDN
jgi:hypothetical protein